MAVRCGDHLLARRDDGSRDRLELAQANTVPLTGFAHGAAGIAWALGELADLTGEARFYTAERSATAYERACSRLGRRTGQTFENAVAGGRRSITMNRAPRSRGARLPGIGLARILSQNRLDFVETRAEIDAAPRDDAGSRVWRQPLALSRRPGQPRDTLASRREAPGPAVAPEATRMGAVTLESIRKDGLNLWSPFRRGDPRHHAGTRGHRLRLFGLAEPRRTSSVLCLSRLDEPEWGRNAQPTRVRPGTRS